MGGKAEIRVVEKRDLINIAILTIIAFVIGFYLIVTTVLISKDGFFYIERAQKLSTDALSVIKTHPPGYPFLIFTAHRFAMFFNEGPSVFTWIYSAQGITLLCRLLALVPLYLTGKLLVGGKNSFLGILILILLPFPTKIVCDVVREWPYLLFLSTGFFFLLWGAKNGKWWSWGLVGLSAGLGYWIRFESAQLILYGFLWIALCLYRPKLWGVSRSRILAGLTLLLIGFSVSVVPYIYCTGTIFPANVNHVIESYSLNPSSDTTDMEKAKTVNPKYYTAEVVPSAVPKVLYKIFNTIGESLMWFFFPALLIGLYSRFRGGSDYKGCLLLAWFIALNISIMVLRYFCIQLHVSQRWSLPFVTFTIFYIPEGLQIIGNFLERNVPINKKRDEKKCSWFLVLLIVGICICLPKLFKPVRIDKQGYRDASDWLRANTTCQDIVAVPDERISFYAERSGIIFTEADISAGTADVVRKVMDHKESLYPPVKSAYIVRVIRQEEQGDGSELPGRLDKKDDAFLSELAGYVPLKNLVAYWPANGDAQDYSIYNNSGTVEGNVDYAPGKYGQAFDLTSSTDGYINCGHDLNSNTRKSLTVSAWVNPMEASKGSIVTRISPFFVQMLKNRRVRAGIYIGSPPLWATVISDSELSLNTWHHIAVTYDGLNLTIFINGEIDKVQEISGQMPITRSPVYIGFGKTSQDQYFKGLIDEVMIFNKALSADKIKVLRRTLESGTVPTFGNGADTDTEFDVLKIERVCQFWLDRGRKKKAVSVYKLTD